MTNSVLELLKADPAGVARSAAATLKDWTYSAHYDTAVIFGSGWDQAVDQLGKSIDEILAADLPGFLPPTVEGHAGMIRTVQVGHHNVLAFRGRKHLYEFPPGQGLEAVVHSVRTAQALGCQTVILTNAVGALSPDFAVGQAVLISDHNDIISGVPSPLPGAAFLDCSEVYDQRLRKLCQKINPGMMQGVYAQVRGPHFETPAAARFLRQNGVDMVGMSIIQEAIMAHFLKMRVLGISLITDPAGEKVSHQEVLAVVTSRAQLLGVFIRQVIEQM